MKKTEETSNKKRSIIVSLLAVIILFIGGYLGNPFAEEKETEETFPNKEITEDFKEQDLEDSNNVKDSEEITYYFRSDELWQNHYEKHGIEMGFDSPKEYLLAANRVIKNENTLHKLEAEDGDDVYYLEESNEFVIVSTDGYLRTYFYPNDGINYFNRQ